MVAFAVDGLKEAGSGKAGLSCTGAFPLSIRHKS